MAVTDVVFNVSYNITNPQAIDGQKKSAEELGATLDGLKNKRISLIDQAAAARDLAKMKEFNATLAETDAALAKLGTKRTRLINEQGAASDEKALQAIKAQLQATEAQIDKMSAKRLRILDDKAAQADLKNIRQITNEIQAAEREMGKLTQTTSYFGRIAKEAQGVFAGMVGFAAIQAAGRGFLELGKNIVTAATEIESLESRFTVLLKSSTKAQTLIQQATELAIVSPFTQSAVLEGAQTLLASGISANSLLSTLRQVAEVSGASETTFQRLVVNYAQINALGKLQGGEIRQFAQNGIPLMAALQKQFGKTSAEIQKMAEKGQISAKAFNKALASLSAEGGLFEGATEKAASTAEGKYSTLKDRIQLTFQQIGKAFLPAIHSFLDAANSFLKGLTPEKVQAFVNVIITLSGWVITLGKGLLYLGTIWVAWRVILFSVTSAFAAYNTMLSIGNGLIIAYTLVTKGATAANLLSVEAMNLGTAGVVKNAGAWRLLQLALSPISIALGLIAIAAAGTTYWFTKMAEEADAAFDKLQEGLDNTEKRLNAVSESMQNAIGEIKDGVLDARSAAKDAQIDINFNIKTTVNKTSLDKAAADVEKRRAELEKIFNAQTAESLKPQTRKFLGVTLTETPEQVKERTVMFVKHDEEFKNAKISQLAKSDLEIAKLEKKAAAETLSFDAAEALARFKTGFVTSQKQADAFDKQWDNAHSRLEKAREDRKLLVNQIAKIIVTPDADAAGSGKAEHIAKLRRDLLVADTKAIEDNIRAMGRQTREFLQQQVDLEAAQAGRFTRVLELQQEFDAEQAKTLEDATEREIVANKKLTEDLLKERRQLAQAAVIKGEDSEAPERRIKEIERIGRMATQAERAAAFARLDGRRDLITHLIALDKNYAEEQLKIAEKQQEDLLAIFVRNKEREILLLQQESVKLIAAAKEQGHSLNKALADMETERTNIAGSQFEEDRMAQVAALKQQAQLRLDEITTREANEIKLNEKLNANKLKQQTDFDKYQQSVLTENMNGGNENTLALLERNYNAQIETNNNEQSLLIIQLNRYHADVKAANFKAFNEEIEQQIGFMDKRNELRQKEADKKLRDRQSEITRQALFPGLVEDVRGFGTTGRGMQLIGQMKGNDEKIGELQALADKVQNAKLGTMKNKEGKLIITEDEKNAELKRISELIGGLRNLNQEHERAFKDERAARRLKNFMTIADGIQQITTSITSGMRALYAANEQFFANAANRQKTKIEDVKNTLIAAQTAGNANLAKINAEQLQLEEARLDQLNKVREEYVRKQQALAVIELIANSTIAIAKAAAQGGIAAPFTIAATLIALAVGLAQAKAQAAAAVAGFKEGGYTGDGGNTQAAGVVHKREFVFTAEKTAKNRKEFEAIHSGRFDLKERLAKASLADTLLNSSLRLRADIADRVIIVKDNRFDELRRLFESGFSKLASKQGLPSNHISVRNTIKGNDLAQIVVNEQRAEARRRK